MLRSSVSTVNRLPHQSNLFSLFKTYPINTPGRASCAKLMHSTLGLLMICERILLLLQTEKSALQMVN